MVARGTLYSIVRFEAGKFGCAIVRKRIEADLADSVAQAEGYGVLVEIELNTL